MRRAKLYIRLTIMAVLQICLAHTAHADEKDGALAAKALIARVLPAHADSFVCQAIPPENGKDVFEIESNQDKIILRGSNGVSLATAFNWYLKYIAHAEFSECGNQLNLPDQLLPVGEKVHITAMVPYRFMFNYCTYGYTMPWWNWDRWQRELDWMAMNGINLPLVITGQEAVWIKTLSQYGYTEQEVRKWLGSPAHFPWMFMQNMENFGGELPASWVPQRVELANKIIHRAHELGMNVVSQAYYGMVPPEFAKRNPGTHVLPQGGWAGGLKRPDLLDPTDPIFARIAATFMQEQEKMYGRTGFYTADPFHEGGNSKGVDLADCGRRVFAAMCTADPKAIWVKMCWQTDNATLLSKIPSDRVIALDLWAEAHPFWTNNAFNGKDWIWCMLGCFGGNTELNADLPHLAIDFSAAIASPRKGRLVGIGLVPEGHCNLPVMYELVPELAWRDHAVDLSTWIPKYTIRRYGTDSAKAHEAWDDFLNSIYSVPASHNEVPANTIFECSPLRTWKARSHPETPYDPNVLVAGWEALLDAASQCGTSDAYRYDVADITRQTLGDLSNVFYQRTKAALDAKNIPEFQKNKTLYLDLLTDMDRLLATRREFLLGVWLEDAKSWGTTPQEKTLYQWQARTLITSWNGKPGSDLDDYANRQWSGLVADYYRARWSLYLDAAGASLITGKPLDTQAFAASLGKMEQAWASADNSYPTQPAGDTLEVAASLRTKYAPLMQTAYPTPITPTLEDVVGCWEYHAMGTTYLRQFNSDGTIQSYQHDSTRLNWFDGFNWKIQGRKIIATRPGTTVSFVMMDKDTLVFTDEGYGNGVRVPAPAAR